MSETNNDFYVIAMPKLSEADIDPETVKPQKTWLKIGNMYKCGNCGKIPTYINIQELKKCPYCDILKSFYEKNPGEFVPMWTEAMLKGEYDVDAKS